MITAYLPSSHADAASEQQAKVSYGQLVTASRWRMLAYEKDPTSVAGATTDFRAAHLASIKPCFNFTALLPELQIQIIELLDYAGLKCLAMSSSRMKQLISTRSSTLDATLFRSALPRTATTLTASVELHPLIFKTKALLAPNAVWSDLLLELSRYWKAEQCLLSHLEEITECATQPPCAEAVISLWSPEWEDEETEAEVPQDAGLAIIPRKLDALGTTQHVTVELFIKAFLEAMESVHVYFWDPELEGVLEGWTFGGWEMKYVDEKGCLVLEDPIWTHREGTGTRFVKEVGTKETR